MWLARCASSSSDKAKSLLTPWKFGLTSKSKYSFCISIDTFDWCLFQLINAISKRGTIFKYYFRFDFSIEVLGLVWLLVSCIPRVSSFISIQFFVLNLDFRFGVLSNRFIIFWFSIFSYYIKFRSSIICCPFSRDLYLSFGISLSSSIFSVFKLFCGELLETFVILYTNLLPIKSLVSAAVFWIAFYETVLIASVADSLAWSRSFSLSYTFKFLPIFSFKFLPIFLTKMKISNRIFDLLL